MAAPLPKPLELIADHYWLVIHRGSQIDRWEVWQYADCGGESWGHLHRNLLLPTTDMGNGPARLICRWENDDCIELNARIESSPQSYTFCRKYRYLAGAEQQYVCPVDSAGPVSPGLAGVWTKVPIRRLT